LLNVSAADAETREDVDDTAPMPILKNAHNVGH